MYGSYSGIFGVRIQTKCQKVSVLVSDPRHLETIIISFSVPFRTTQWTKLVPQNEGSNLSNVIFCITVY